MFVSRRLPWLNLAGIGAAEIMLLSEAPQIGLTAYAALLLWFLTQYTLFAPSDASSLTLVLLPIPLMRLIAFALPLASIPPPFWLICIYAPLAIPIWMLTRSLPDSASTRRKQARLLPQVLLVVASPGLGILAFFWWHPWDYLPAMPTSVEIIALGIGLFVGAGVLEEWLFRRLIQSAAVALFAWWGVIYTALLYTLTLLSTIPTAALVGHAAIAFCFGFVVYRSNTVVGTALAHGVLNLTAGMVFPYLSAYHIASMSIIVQTVLFVSGSALIALIWILAREQTNDND